MTATHKARYCRCGARLARDNPGTRCAPCAVTDRDRVISAPEVPEDFWNEVVLRDALASRHMGRVIRAWRTHPHHGRNPIPQERVASWMGITQAQLSRIENGAPLAHLDRLIQWAQILRVPAGRLWFAMPTTADNAEEKETDVNRRDFLASAGLTMASGLAPQQDPGGDDRTDQDAAQWLAWQLWTQRTRELHQSQVPPRLVRRLDSHPHVIRHRDDLYRFTDPAMVDALVADRIFGDIASGSGHLLATAQTSHATDVIISKLAGRDDTAQQGLATWMHRGATAVLRVNAAGILAKVGPPDLGDSAILAIRNDYDVRHLYLTAVASRILSAPWEQASELANATLHATPPPDEFMNGRELWIAGQLAAELTNTRDAAARWCSATLLSSLSHSATATTHRLIVQATQDEPCRENLRAYAAVLAGVSPISS